MELGWENCNMRGHFVRKISFTLSEASLKFHPKFSFLFHGNPHPDRKNHESVEISFKEKYVKKGGLGIKSQGFNVIKFKGGEICQGFHKSFFYYLVFILMNKKTRKEVP